LSGPLYREVALTDVLRMTSKQVKSLARSLQRSVGSLFIVEHDSRGVLAVHVPSATRFRFFPGGTYAMGLSQAEESAARRIMNPFPANISEMRPERTIQIAPLLIMESPATIRLAENLIHFHDTSDKAFPAYLTKSEADALAVELQCRLPLESEWESACRAGSRSLFVFGDELPAESELASWFQWDLSAPLHHPANSIGLVGLFFGEWCADQFRVSLADNAPVESDSFVVRGGGAFFWPWQDDEWVWCMSAVRMPSSGLPADKRCATRLVYDVP